ncbi:MAG: hypothetical protein HY951_18185 [Bacteroidia bacterium]|nr:hypothetical protein [Bacteroidia bacterium]
MYSKLTNVVASKCAECGKTLKGRLGQKFCNVYCKSAYHYKNSKLKESSIYVRVDTILKHNRRVLKQYNLSGQSQVKEEVLINEGFNFDYYTTTWKAKNGNIYYFCYEFGYRNLEDGKYMLIMWQDYMNKRKFL